MTKVEDKLVDLKSLRVIFQTIVNEVGIALFDLRDQINNMQNGKVDVVCQSTHHTDYTKDTLEFVTDSTGKVTNVYFISDNPR